VKKRVARAVIRDGIPVAFEADFVVHQIPVKAYLGLF
jgi:hypothetical protein